MSSLEQKWNIPADRAQWLDEKNGVICLVIMFAPRVMVIKMLKMAVGVKYLNAPERSYWKWYG